MPSKNVVKTYVKNGHYHVYNRGVEKRVIFNDEQDYKVFLNYLKEYLSPPPTPKDMLVKFNLRGRSFKGLPRLPNNYHDKIELLAYCLIPNHFHLLIKIKKADALKKFVQSFSTRYSVYFNKKYQRVGPLFQGKYKALLVQEDAYLLHLSRYIHLNPGEHQKNLIEVYSSYGDYLGIRKTKWVKPGLILKFFNQAKLPFIKKRLSYKDFVEKHKSDSEETLGDLTLEALKGSDL